jgi:hypothetical protein
MSKAAPAAKAQGLNVATIITTVSEGSSSEPTIAVFDADKLKATEGEFVKTCSDGTHDRVTLSLWDALLLGTGRHPKIDFLGNVMGGTLTHKLWKAKDMSTHPEIIAAYNKHQRVKHAKLCKQFETNPESTNFKPEDFKKFNKEVLLRRLWHDCMLTCASDIQVLADIDYDRMGWHNMRTFAIFPDCSDFDNDDEDEQ